MDWTGPADLTAQVQRLWDSGRLLAHTVDGTPLFPFDLRLRRPDARALGESFGEVQQWIVRLREGSRENRGFGYEIAWEEVGHRQVGRNRIPRSAAIPSMADALKLIGKEKDAERFRELASLSIGPFPSLASWIARKPLLALYHFLLMP